MRPEGYFLWGRQSSESESDSDPEADKVGGHFCCGMIFGTVIVCIIGWVLDAVFGIKTPYAFYGIIFGFILGVINVIKGD